MTEEFIDERERDFLDYLRNNLVDPESRGIEVIEEHTATSGQTVFSLRNNFVKNVADTITIDGITLKKGYDYKVLYGEGKDLTKVILIVSATDSQSVIIEYTYGKAFIEREYSRTDVLLPRIVIHFLTGSEDYAGLGDYIEGQRGSYFNVTYNIEIRDKFATRARKIASEAFNVCRKLRHANLFRNNISRAYNLVNFDFDPEKDAYVWIFSIDIQWEIMF